MYSRHDHNTSAKPFYRPIDAALRWCNLLAYEGEILESVREHHNIFAATFPQWPCLHANMERITDAIRNNELRYGALGITVKDGTPVDPRLLTVRHSDLKHWMYHYYPEERPSFLFSPTEIEQGRIHYDSYVILQADRDALKIQLKAAEEKFQILFEELKAAGLERDGLRIFAQNNQRLSDQSKTGFLNVIGALVNLTLGSSKAGQKHSVFENQTSIVDSITAHYPGILGLSKRSLDEKFAAGKRSLSLAQAKT